MPSSDHHIARDEGGSGSLLAVGIIGATIAAFGLVVPLYLGLEVRQQVDAAADASALAGADVDAGIAPGSPCLVAGEIASSNDVEVDGCTVDGLTVTVRVGREFSGVRLVATATAGPPPPGTN